MIAIWYKEFREFSAVPPLLLLRLLLPVAVLAPALQNPGLRLPALAAAVAYLGAATTGAQVARERISGLLPRLAITPVPTERLMLHRIVCRSLLVLVQLSPAVALAWSSGAPPEHLWSVLPMAPAACGLGALFGLRAPSRRGAQMAGLVTTGVAAALGLSAATGPLAGHGPGGPAGVTLSIAALPAQAALWLLAVGLVSAALRAASGLFVANEP